jgi:hypothetical protein
MSSLSSPSAFGPLISGKHDQLGAIATRFIPALNRGVLSSIHRYHYSGSHFMIIRRPWIAPHKR